MLAILHTPSCIYNDGEQIKDRKMFLRPKKRKKCVQPLVKRSNFESHLNYKL
jgi:hypothetical protein